MTLNRNRSTLVLAGFALAGVSASAVAVTLCTGSPNLPGTLGQILNGTQGSTPPTTPCNSNTFSDAVEICGDEIFVPPGPLGQKDQCKFCFWAEFAAFENETGIVALDEIVSLPGTPGFRFEALNAPSSQIIFRGLNNGNDEPGICTTLTLDAGRSYIFWVVQNDNRAAALTKPTIDVFFSIAAANSDLFDHFLQFTSAQNTGVSAFALEDLTGGGDEDFTDTVFTVKCNQPPDCSGAAPSLTDLWPPNHNFVPINVEGVTDPDGDPVTITIDGIFQDEPLDTFGDGSFEPDGLGIDTDTAWVRAERSGTRKVPGNGRVYRIDYTADDGNGGTCDGSVTVCVPHDQRPGSVCVDDGTTVDSTGP